MEKYEVKRMLPHVGDQRMEIPTITEGKKYSDKPQRCVVVEVNQAHMWYTVQFENGFRESYKLPKIKPGSGGPVR